MRQALYTWLEEGYEPMSMSMDLFFNIVTGQELT
jgi:hypothetical protein